MNPTPGIAVEVHVDLDTGTTFAGTVYFNTRRGQLGSTFTYDRDYLSSSDSFDISPDLPRANVTSVTEGLPGALSDSAPDRWGRNLILKKVQSAAQDAGRRLPTLTEVDYLLGVSDLTRQGALRYQRDSLDFLASGADVPKLIELPQLLNAAMIVARDARGADEFAAIKALLDAERGHWVALDPRHRCAMEAVSLLPSSRTQKMSGTLRPGRRPRSTSRAPLAFKFRTTSSSALTAKTSYSWNDSTAVMDSESLTSAA